MAKSDTALQSLMEAFSSGEKLGFAVENYVVDVINDAGARLTNKDADIEVFKDALQFKFADQLEQIELVELVEAIAFARRALKLIIELDNFEVVQPGLFNQLANGENVAETINEVAKELARSIYGEDATPEQIERVSEGLKSTLSERISSEEFSSLSELAESLSIDNLKAEISSAIARLEQEANAQPNPLINSLVSGDGASETIDAVLADALSANGIVNPTAAQLAEAMANLEQLISEAILNDSPLTEVTQTLVEAVSLQDSVAKAVPSSADIAQAILSGENAEAVIARVLAQTNGGAEPTPEQIAQVLQSVSSSLEAQGGELQAALVAAAQEAQASAAETSDAPGAGQAAQIGPGSDDILEAVTSGENAEQVIAAVLAQSNGGVAPTAEQIEQVLQSVSSSLQAQGGELQVALSASGQAGSQALDNILNGALEAAGVDTIALQQAQASAAAASSASGAGQVAQAVPGSADIVQAVTSGENAEQVIAQVLAQANDGVAPTAEQIDQVLQSVGSSLEAQGAQIQTVLITSSQGEGSQALDSILNGALQAAGVDTTVLQQSQAAAGGGQVAQTGPSSADILQAVNSGENAEQVIAAVLAQSSGGVAPTAEQIEQVLQSVSSSLESQGAELQLALAASGQEGGAGSQALDNILNGALEVAGVDTTVLQQSQAGAAEPSGASGVVQVAQEGSGSANILQAVTSGENAEAVIAAVLAQSSGGAAPTPEQIDQVLQSVSSSLETQGAQLQEALLASTQGGGAGLDSQQALDSILNEALEDAGVDTTVLQQAQASAVAASDALSPDQTGDAGTGSAQQAQTSPAETSGEVDPDQEGVTGGSSGQQILDSILYEALEDAGVDTVALQQAQQGTGPSGEALIASLASGENASEVVDTLLRQTLAQSGITDPTPEQLSESLSILDTIVEQSLSSGETFDEIQQNLESGFAAPNNNVENVTDTNLLTLRVRDSLTTGENIEASVAELASQINGGASSDPAQMQELVESLNNALDSQGGSALNASLVSGENVSEIVGALLAQTLIQSGITDPTPEQLDQAFDVLDNVVEQALSSNLAEQSLSSGEIFDEIQQNLESQVTAQNTDVESDTGSSLLTALTTGENVEASVAELASQINDGGTADPEQVQELVQNLNDSLDSSLSEGTDLSDALEVAVQNTEEAIAQDNIESQQAQDNLASALSSPDGGEQIEEVLDDLTSSVTEGQTLSAEQLQEVEEVIQEALTQAISNNESLDAALSDAVEIAQNAVSLIVEGDADIPAQIVTADASEVTDSISSVENLPETSQEPATESAASEEAGSPGTGELSPSAPDEIITPAETAEDTAASSTPETTSSEIASLSVLLAPMANSAVDFDRATGSSETPPPSSGNYISDTEEIIPEDTGDEDDFFAFQTNIAANANDLPAGSVTISGVAAEDQVLTANSTLTDEDGLGTLNYQWHADGVDIIGATSSTYTLTQAEVGTVITVTVSYIDDQGTSESVTSPTPTDIVANVNDLPAGSVTISGVAAEYQVLTANSTLTDEDGLGTLNYQWHADGVDIIGATNSTYTLTQAEVGTVITVTVSYTDDQGTLESVTSPTPTEVVANVNDLPAGTVTISGVATEDQVLTANSTLTDEDGLGILNYQWHADGVDIIGATDSTYTLTQNEVGKAITVTVSYIDDQGTSESVTSPTPTDVVANVNDLPAGTVTISGNAVEDQVLTANSALTDEDGIGALNYQWHADGVDIIGATNSTYTLTQAEVGTVITVTVSYTDDQGTPESVTSPTPTDVVANVNDLPAGSVTISGVAAEDQVLTANSTLTDEDGLGTLNYQWHADGVDIIGATDSTYTLTQAEVGTVITVTVSYVDGQGTSESVTSPTPTDVVANVNDLPAGTVTISGVAAEDQVVTANSTLTDEDGIGALNYQWHADGVDIIGATNSTYTLTQAEVGTVITVTVSYVDGQGTSESVTSPTPTDTVANVNDLPAGTVTISGNAVEDQVLTANNTLADEDGLGTLNYQWHADGVDIIGATDSTYTLTQNEVGKAITVTVSYTDDQGTLESVTSPTPTDVVANVNDLPAGTVTISGNAVEDQVLLATPTLTDEDGIGTLNYQWHADGIDIDGATSSAYILTQAEVGKTITVTVSYTDGQGVLESITSATPTVPVANVNDLPTGSVTISGNAVEDQVLTANNTLADEDGIGTLNYQWQADGTAISGATDSTYLLTQAEVGKIITVRVSYIDNQGTLESVLSPVPTDAVENIEIIVSPPTPPVGDPNNPPTGEVTISGTPNEDQVLTANNTLADEDGLGALNYQWQADGTDISGATNNTYLLTQAEVGKSIAVTVSYTDGLGTLESVTSAPTTTVIGNLPPAPISSAVFRLVDSQSTNEDDTLTRTDADESPLSDAGNDTLMVNDGKNTFHGSVDDEISEIKRFDSSTIDGDVGDDTVNYSGSSLTLELAAIAYSKLQDIENIGRVGNGENTIQTDKQNVIAQSSESNQITIFGDSNDSATATDQWVFQNTSDGFDILTLDEAVPLVDDTITNQTIA